MIVYSYVLVLVHLGHKIEVVRCQMTKVHYSYKQNSILFLLTMAPRINQFGFVRFAAVHDHKFFLSTILDISFDRNGSILVNAGYASNLTK